MGEYTGVCGMDESYDAMQNALDTAQSARMFKYKPESEVTLQARSQYFHQHPTAGAYTRPLFSSTLALCMG